MIIKQPDRPVSKKKMMEALDKSYNDYKEQEQAAADEREWYCANYARIKAEVVNNIRINVANGRFDFEPHIPREEDEE